MIKLNKKNIFLFDAAGAMLSALFTGVLLPQFSEWLGLSSKILHCLALLPLTYCIYSMTCYLRTSKIKPWMLPLLILSNIFYCALSGILIFSIDSITTWGQLLLLSEIFVILIVIAIELNVYVKTKASGK